MSLNDGRCITALRNKTDSAQVPPGHVTFQDLFGTQRKFDRVPALSRFIQILAQSFAGTSTSAFQCVGVAPKVGGEFAYGLVVSYLSISLFQLTI